jgi:hypothetical protein
MKASIITDAIGSNLNPVAEDVRKVERDCVASERGKSQQC